MSIERHLVHVAGTAGSGKTTLIERLLESNRSRLLAVARCEACCDRERPAESNAKRDAELARYREAGASSAARYRFPAGEFAHDDFYSTEFMADYSEGILLEGDAPLEYVDLAVHVMRPLPGKQKLLRRAVARGPNPTWEMTGDLARMLAALLQGPSGKRGRHWTLADEHSGLELAQVVVINVRDERERERAESTLREIGRLRSDESVFQDVIGWRGRRTPITAGVADLSDRRDPSLKRVLTRIKRAFNTRA
ncbi:MAG: hypothetical protein GY711_07115 [bacterium]|nr:hypothetical protein [bacterium]